MIRKFLILLIVAFFTNTSAFNQEDDLLLTSGDVSKFISTYPSLKADFESFGIKYDDDNNDFSLPEGVKAMEEINKIVMQHGYADLSEYFAKAGIILTTYAAIRMNLESTAVQPELQKAITEIKNNPYYSAEQKEQLVEALKQGSAALSGIQEEMADSKNVAVVKPYLDAIEKVIEEK